MLVIPQRKRPGPKPRERAVRPTLFQGGTTGPRPLTWCTGPDPVRHRMFVAYGRAKCQAEWRGEGWLLTFADYEDIWQGRWHLRGRTRDTLCLARLDYEQPWSRANVEIMTRRQHNINQLQCRRATG
jgi:hypothetical protein